MKRFGQFALVALIGIGVGAALDETWHAVRNPKAQAQAQEPNSNELFQRRLRCKSEADDYARKSSESNSSLVVDKVEYSPSRHSCIASFTRITSGAGTELWSFETIDILTSETLFSEECVENDPNDKRFCGNGRDMVLRKGREDALAAALSR
jgi:hypothetical protein